MDVIPNSSSSYLAWHISAISPPSTRFEFDADLTPPIDTPRWLVSFFIGILSAGLLLDFILLILRFVLLSD